MTPLSRIEELAAAQGLAVLGGFLAGPEDGLPQGCQSLVLLGPREPGFWAQFTQSPEWQDGAPDPMDRWSRRVIGHLACGLGAKALFPFGGPPWHPFYSWAVKSGQTWESPVRLLVQKDAGLMVSFRGALALKEAIDLPAPSAAPCAPCAKPCLTACPVSALGPEGYDVPKCHAYLDSPEGADCMTRGCAVRRACPLSIAYARLPDHSAYHMRQFHK
jgi:epoxyqueuosine reductase